MKKVVLMLLLFSVSPSTQPITPKAMLQTEASACALAGTCLAISTFVWASHAKKALNLNMSNPNKIDKAIHSLMIYSTGFAAAASAIGCYLMLSSAYDLFRLQSLCAQ